MDLKAYYKRLREVESSLQTPYVVVVSLDTPDGGKAGVYAEVTKLVAARTIAEGRTRLASETETTQFREQQVEAQRDAHARAAAQRMQVTLVPIAESRTPKISKNA